MSLVEEIELESDFFVLDGRNLSRFCEIAAARFRSC